MTIDVGSALVEALVAPDTQLGVHSALLEVLVAPDLDTTKVHSALLEVLVAPGTTFVHSALLEVLVAPDREVSVLETTALAVEMHIIEEQEARPVTGLFSEIVDASGWKWDRRRLEDSRQRYNQYSTYLGGHLVGLKDGTIKQWWQSGTTQGCEYLDLTHKLVHDYQTWTPEVAVGSYSLQFEKHSLYSDYSYADRFATDQLDADGLMSLDLRDDAQWDSIQIALWYRDDTFVIRKLWDFKYVDAFTGAINESSHQRLDAENDDGSPIVANLDDRKKEYRIRDGRVILNGNHYIDNIFVTSAGWPAPPVLGTGDVLFSGGQSQPDGRSILLQYLPVQQNSVVVWVNEGGTLVEYELTANLAFSEPTDRHFQVDYDLGIVTMPGFQAGDLILHNALEDTDLELTVYPNEEILNEYPLQGVLTIGTEEIAYYERAGNVFSSLVRGYNGTISTSHSVGDLVQHRRMGRGTDGSVFVEYIAVPRIDYEVTPHLIRTANQRAWLDVRPISNVETGNILQIYPGDVSLNSIVLTTDSALIGGNLYGPVFYGSDVSELIATGYDPNGNPVPDVELTIAILEGAGLLNGVSGSYTDISNTLGQIYALYNHPMDRDEFEFDVDSVTYDSGNTIMSVPGLDADVDVDDVWVFQVLKFDKLVGTVGLPLEVVDENIAVEPYGLYYLDLDGLISEQDFKGGVAAVIIGGVKYYRNITWVYNQLNVDDVEFSRVYLDAALPTAIGSTAYLFEPQAVEWDPALLNGTRYILYEYRDDVLHPITGDLGAYYPLHPDDVSDGEIIFTGRTLPIPDPNDPAENVGAYVVIAPDRVTLQAYGRDPITGRLIQSNTIQLSLELPNFAVGVDTSGPLPIPRGWTFPTEENNVGAGLGGANFITINPASTGINQLALQLELS